MWIHVYMQDNRIHAGPDGYISNNYMYPRASACIHMYTHVPTTWLHENMRIHNLGSRVRVQGKVLGSGLGIVYSCVCACVRVDPFHYEDPRESTP